MEADLSLEHGHLCNMGRLIEEMESKLRNGLDQVHSCCEIQLLNVVTHCTNFIQTIAIYIYIYNMPWLYGLVINEALLVLWIFETSEEIVITHYHVLLHHYKMCIEHVHTNVGGYVVESMVLIFNINNGMESLPVGIKIVTPFSYWDLVDISRWENLCIPESLFGSKPF